MPRPKPPEPLKVRYVRLSDKQWMIFQHLGSAEWLRKLLDKKDPFPKKYYDASSKCIDSVEFSLEGCKFTLEIFANLSRSPFPLSLC